MPLFCASRPLPELPLQPEIHSSRSFPRFGSPHALRLSETRCPPLNGFWAGTKHRQARLCFPWISDGGLERKILKRPSPTLETFRKVGVKFLSGFCGFLVQRLCRGTHGR